MIIRDDELDSIAIDRFVSASGRWLSLLCERYEGTPSALRGFYIVIATADTKRVRMVKRIAFDNPDEADRVWETWRAIFGGPTARTYEDDVPSGLDEFKVISPPHPIEEDQAMILKMRPRGARLFVRDITPVDEVTARAEAAGLAVVVAEEHKPKPTTAVVLAVGEDPLARELYQPGYIVMFSRYAGQTFQDVPGGPTYRSLELHEIIGCRDPAAEMEDLGDVSTKDQSTH